MINIEMTELYKRYPVVCTIWAFLEVLLFAGVLYGWSSLVYILKEEGFYLELCTNEENITLEAGDSTVQNHSVAEFTDYDVIHDVNASVPDIVNNTNEIPRDLKQLGCPLQESQLNLWFSIAVSFTYLSFIGMGYIIRICGVRITRTIFIIIYLCGTLCLGFATPEIPWLVLPGLCCIGIGGLVVVGTNLQVAELHPHMRSTIVATFTGLFDFSSIVKQLVRVAYENGIARQKSYISFGCVFTVIVSISTLFFLPKKHMDECYLNELKKRRRSLAHTDLIKQVPENYTNNASNATDRDTRDTLLDDTSSARLETPAALLYDKDTVCAYSPGVLLDDDKDNTRLDATDTSVDVKGCVRTDHPDTLIDYNNSVRPDFPVTLVDATGIAHPDTPDYLVDGTNSTRPVSPDGSVDESDYAHPNILNDELDDTTRVRSVSPGAFFDDINNMRPGETGVVLDKTDVAHLDIPKGKSSDLVEGGAMVNTQTSNTRLASSLLSLTYILHLYWLFVHSLRLLTFIGLVNVWLENIFHEEQKVGDMLAVFSYMTMGALLTSLLCGFTYDLMRRKFLASSQLKRIYLPVVLPMSLVIVYSITSTVMCFIKHDVSPYVAFIAFTFFRSSLWTVGLAFVGDAFPLSHFYVLWSLTQVMVGIAGLIQYPIFQWYGFYDGASNHVNLFLLFMQLTTIIHPVILYIRGSRDKADDKKNPFTNEFIIDRSSSSQ